MASPPDELRLEAKARVSFFWQSIGYSAVKLHVLFSVVANIEPRPSGLSQSRAFPQFTRSLYIGLVLQHNLFILKVHFCGVCEPKEYPDREFVHYQSKT